MKTMMPYLVRFLVGGTIVALVSVIAKLSPHISGVLSAFPAVFLTALVLIRYSSGHHKSVDFAEGGLHGVIGTLFTVLGTLSALIAHLPWYVAVICGFAAYGAYGLYIMRKHA